MVDLNKFISLYNITYGEEEKRGCRKKRKMKRGVELNFLEVELN